MERLFSGLVFIPRINHADTIAGYLDVQRNGLATHLAILDVFLLFNRSIQKDADGFSAVRATDVGFLDKFHVHNYQFTPKLAFG